MSRATRHLLTGGLIIMTMAPTATAADETALTIVNPQGLFDPTDPAPI